MADADWVIAAVLQYVDTDNPPETADSILARTLRSILIMVASERAVAADMLRRAEGDDREVRTFAGALVQGLQLGKLEMCGRIAHAVADILPDAHRLPDAGTAYDRAWIDGVRWAAAEADAQAAGREPVYILDITDHIRSCATDPDRKTAVDRSEAPAEYED